MLEANQQNRVQTHVDVEEELRRTIPVIKSISKKLSIPISIDTTKAKVAEAALDSGAEIINDISAMRFDQGMVRGSLKTKSICNNNAYERHAGNDAKKHNIC